MSEKHESENDNECNECGYVHPDDAQCDEWIAGEWECARCNTTVQLDDGLDMPRHRMCHPCATAALDEVNDVYQGTLRQLAEVTAERDALDATTTATRTHLQHAHHILIGDEDAEDDNERLARDVLRGVEAMEESLRATERALDAACTERDALKRRVEEITSRPEHRCRSHGAVRVVEGTADEKGHVLLWCLGCGAISWSDGGSVSLLEPTKPPPGQSAFLRPIGLAPGTQHS